MKKRYLKNEIAPTLQSRTKKELQIMVNKYIYRAKNYKNYSQSHIGNIDTILNDFTGYIHTKHRTDRYSLNKIKVDHIEDYIIWKSQTPVKKTSRYYNINQTMCDSTLSSYVSTIRCFFSYCNKNGIQCLDATRIENRKFDRAKILVLTDQEREDLFACPDLYEDNKATALRNKIFIYMLYYTGCRISEIINITFSEIDLYSNQLQIRGKGGKIRGVFITDKIKEMIRQYRQERNRPRYFRGKIIEDKYQTDNIFVSHSENYFFKPCNIGVFQAMFAFYRLKMKAGKPITAHILRHTFATDLMKRGGDVRVVQIMMGHDYLETTMRYTHVSDSMMSNTHLLLQKKEVNECFV